MLPKVCEWTVIAFTKNHWILSIHSNFTNKNVSWLHFSWPPCKSSKQKHLQSNCRRVRSYWSTATSSTTTSLANCTLLSHASAIFRNPVTYVWWKGLTSTDYAFTIVKRLTAKMFNSSLTLPLSERSVTHSHSVSYLPMSHSTSADIRICMVFQFSVW